jgi:glycosyltransferase involved in cell wall biosynthesis
MSDSLAIVMPVYNEEASVAKVINEWLPALNELEMPYKIIAINDGSSDKTLEVLMGYEKKYWYKIKVHSQGNKGHGQSCIEGYKIAINENFKYILQIDSDGQCDPRYFRSFWELRDKSPVYGYRKTRDDGAARWWISRVVSIVGLLGTGIWVKDANVPYRLMSKEQIGSVLESIPDDFHLANILVSLKLRQKYSFKWVKIHFRDRFGGTPSIKAYSFVKQGLKLIWQLWMS